MKTEPSDNVIQLRTFLRKSCNQSKKFV